ncbi:hypothetical protein, partial [Enterobacter chuandaensis]|uniref:hypothetical protein n=1 Tax=Enterobacter chuandaensis TaxID=2497875 RepID=UPI001C502506
FAVDTDDLFVLKALLRGDVLMWLMKTSLTSVCINQRGAGQRTWSLVSPCFPEGFRERIAEYQILQV